MGFSLHMRQFTRCTRRAKGQAMTDKIQVLMMGEWITVLSLSLESVSGTHFIAMTVQGVDSKRLKSLADWVQQSWKADIVAIVGLTTNTTGVFNER